MFLVIILTTNLVYLELYVEEESINVLDLSNNAPTPAASERLKMIGGGASMNTYNGNNDGGLVSRKLSEGTTKPAGVRP